jgi:hypothetical protein
MKQLSVMNSPLVRTVLLRPACRHLVNVYILYFYSGSTMEGGDADAHTMCIVWWQNSIQSSLIRQYNRFYNLQTGNRFVVRMLPGCDTVKSSSGASKRSAVSALEQSGQIRSQKDGNNTLISSSYNIWRQDPIPRAPNGTGNIFVPLGAVAPGVFDTKLHITGTLDRLQVLGDDGTECSRYVWHTFLSGKSSASHCLCSFPIS